jgi:hypothetical protein
MFSKPRVLGLVGALAIAVAGSGLLASAALAATPSVSPVPAA